MSYTRRRRGQRRRQRFWTILELLCICLLIIALILIARKLAARRRIAGEEQSSAQIMQTIAETTPVPAADPVVQSALLPLLEQNPDTVGILNFDGGRSLYVCQADDNIWYMDHRFDGSPDPAGMIFMDYRNTLLPRSDNLILYGHNMADGSRFGTLKRFQSIDHLLANPAFTLADLYSTTTYVPFAIFNTTVLPDDPAYFPFDQPAFASEADFNAYISEVRARSIHFLPGEIPYGTKLLTLATCSSEHERGRLVIVCREA